MEQKNKVHKIVLAGLCTALLAVLSQISFPLPSGVPVTLQTFAVALCGSILGGKLGLLSMAVYLALGAVGLPVFAGFMGGVGVFAGMTGGYLWGFLLMTALCGLGSGASSRAAAVLLGCAGLLLCHLCGTIQFSIVSKLGIAESFALASLPYLLKDVISVVLGYSLAQAVLSALKKAGLLEANE